MYATSAGKRAVNHDTFHGNGRVHGMRATFKNQSSKTVTNMSHPKNSGIRWFVDASFPQFPLILLQLHFDIIRFHFVQVSFDEPLDRGGGGLSSFSMRCLLSVKLATPLSCRKLASRQPATTGIQAD